MKTRIEFLEARLLLHGEAVFHTHHENIPNYVQEPDTVTVADGNWFDPAVWSNGVPTAEMDAQIDHAVVIAPLEVDLDGDYNHNGLVDIGDYVLWRDSDGRTESYDSWIRDFSHGNLDAVVDDLNLYGSLSFNAQADTSLTVTTLTVPESGRLELGTADNPISGNSEIIFRDKPIDTQFDPKQFGHGLIMFGNAELSVYGQENTSFLEVAVAPKAGDTVITLQGEPQNWLPGDELFIADSRQTGRHQPKFDHAERMVVASVDGNQVTLVEPLQFDHPGYPDNPDLLPHVAHLGGNVTFRSENPEGTRGHIIVMERTDVRVHDAVFADLGRTTSEFLDNSHVAEDGTVLHVGKNQIGRYTFHMHHVYGKEGLEGIPQFEIEGNVFRDGKRWGLALHSTSYGDVLDNVFVDFQSAGIVFEDSSEIGNTISRNYIGLIHGSGASTQGRVGDNADPLFDISRSDPRATHKAGVLWGDGTPENPYRTLGDLGHEGAGIWGRGVANNVVDNVVANSPNGHVYWTRFHDPPPYPMHPGANPHHHGVQNIRGQQLDHVFRGNEVYGSGTAYVFLGVAQGHLLGKGKNAYQIPDTVMLLEDMKAWSSTFGVDIFYSGIVEIKDSKILVGWPMLRSNFTKLISWEDTIWMNERDQSMPLDGEYVRN